MQTFPLQDGRCRRCRASQQEGRAFCGECSLRLAPGNEAMEGRIRLTERAWLADHPAVAERWAIQLADAGIPLDPATASLHGDEAAALEAEAARDAKRDEAVDGFRYWAQRAGFLDHLMREARHSLSQARDACRDAGVTDDDLRADLSVATTPGVRELLEERPRRSAAPLRDARAAGSGGSFFFVSYSESGYDFDGDGDVDGGLIDTLGEAASDVADAAGEAAGSVFGAIGDLF